MKKKFFKKVLSFALALSMVIPSTPIAVEAADSAVYEYEEVAVTEPVSNSWHVVADGTTPSGDGPAAWAFDNIAGSHWHSNYTASTETAENIYGGNLTWGTVGTIPEFADVADSRTWIGGSFGKSINFAKMEYTGRAKQANWYGQYALYTANVTSGEVKDSDFELAASGTNTGFSKVTITLEAPKKATHFRFVAFTANPNGNNYVSASEIDVYEAIAADTTQVFGGAIVDTDTQWTQDRLGEVKKLTKNSETLTAWKNDKASSEIALYAAFAAYDDVTLNVSELSDGNGNKISADNVTASFIKSTKAYNGGYLGYGSPDRAIPADNGTNRSESSDIIWGSDPVDMAANSVQPVWVEIAVPEDAKAGTYTGTVTVSADGVEEPLVFNYTVEVLDAVLPDATDYTFDIMQWQYPYSSAEYYDVEPFSEEHFEILESHMGIYKEVGGSAITTTFTEEAWSGQTYSANSIHYPSMVKWTKNADGSFSYDYTDFDAWVAFCKEMGLGDKIVAYGIAPWHGSFTYWTAGAENYTKEAYSVGNARYVAVWTDFLTDFAAHLEEKGWKDNVYIGIDERGVNASAFNLADAAGLKTAADIDNITNHWEIAQRVTELNVGDTAAYKLAEEFAELKEIRDAKGFRTTLYSCTEHQPGNFSLSSPVESYWTVLNAGMMGADGFNRWAYDAWVADPLRDATHNSFEPGDCFVVFPDEKDAENPTSRYSVRLARMAEGVRDVNKLEIIKEELPVLANDVDAVYENIDHALSTGRSYLGKDAVADLAAEAAAFKADVNELSEKYAAIKNGELMGVFGVPENVEIEMKDTYQLNPEVISDKEDKTVTYESADEKIATVDKDGLITAVGRGTTTIKVKNAAGGYEAEVQVEVFVEISIISKVPKYELPEKYQSDVEGPYEKGHKRYYMGQPDMVQTETGRLITVFPTGHGHGPLIMKISEDNGETWTEKTNIPASWAESQETPTIYSLKVDDGKGGLKERLVLICACPAWDKYVGGWQMSYSDDNGETWTEFETFWSEINGQKNYTIVAMASLIQLKDEDGNYIQKWMGVYHNDSYVNSKSYLTFDENGAPQWSKPEAYLSEYRGIESSHQICEVGMFRSPDGERIVALGRTQTHNAPATMFYSDDEGETWSEPVELPGSLAGERHKALYDPISGKLVITFREIIYDRNGNGVWEGGSDWICGEWVAWVGTYEDLMNLQQGDYKIILDTDYSGNYYSGDTGYTGMAVLPDGTFILHSYGHWDESSANVSDVRTDLCWIRQAKFKLTDVEALEPIPEPEDPNDDSKDLPTEGMKLTAGSLEKTEGSLEALFDGNPSSFYHSNWSDKTNFPVKAEDFWIMIELPETREVSGLRYLPRQGSPNGRITSYEISYSVDGENWEVAATGNWENNEMWKVAEFDNNVQAKYVKLFAVNSNADNSGRHLTGAELRLTFEEKGGNEEPKPADKTALNAAIARAEALNAEDYEDFSAVEETLAAAKTIAGATAVAQEEVDLITERLNKAIDELVEKEEPKQEVCEIYPDVIHGEWYEAAVQYVHDNGIMTGSNGLFKPTGEDGKLLRQQFVMILWRMEGEPAAETDAAIKDLQDINGDEWYIDALCWAYENGVVTGVGGTMFKGGNPITRQQLATMMYRYADKMGYDTSKTADYSDMPGANDVESYAAEGMAWAVGSGIISGSGADKALNPTAGATRAQIATVIQRFCEENK